MKRRYLSIYFQSSTQKQSTADFKSLLSFCKRYTPLVSLDEPSGILLDTTGCEELFKGERLLLSTINKDLQNLGFIVQVAIAPTPLSARSMARFKPFTIIGPRDLPQALYTLPIESLELEKKVAHALHELGIKTLLQLFRLPRAQILARFGIAVVNRIEEIRGERQATRDFIKETRHFSIKEELMETIRDSSYLCNAVFVILKRLCEMLSKDGLGLQELELVLTHLDRQQTHIKTGLVSASANALQIFRLLTLKLEQLNAGLGVESIELKAHDVKSIVPKSISLSGQSELVETSLSGLFDTLLCKIDKKNIFQYTHYESHIPENNHNTIDPAAIISRLSSKQRLTFNPPCTVPNRPTHLFSPPEPICVIAMLPDSPPRRITWRNRFVFYVKKADGPERIEAQWWSDTEQKTRDYYHIEDVQGLRLWVFKQTQANYSESTWYIHGLMA